MTVPDKQQVTQNQVTGRVATILNARELVITVGSDKGDQLGMKFAILAETPMEVLDPETLDVLDIIDREKVRVEAAEVRPKITICRTYKTKKTSGGVYSPIGVLGALRAADMFETSKEIVETLRAKDSSLSPPLSPEESYVKINDRVISISDPD